MNAMAAPLTEEQMRDIAAFYAGDRLQSGAAQQATAYCWASRSTVAAWRHARSRFARAATAHGRGIPAQYPRIGSQHEEYVEAQLGRLRSGARANSALMCH